jgi:hypothetical protein
MSVASWKSSWLALKRKLAMNCEGCGGLHSRRRRGKSRGVSLQGAWYCGAKCLERALPSILEPRRRGGGSGASHRIPLGLLLLSRQQLTAVQLRTALEAQRSAGHSPAGHRKIGEWLQELGFATEWQITVALARQWSCPLLRGHPGSLGEIRLTSIPVLLLETFQMIPVELSEASQTLLMAFSEGIDHSVLYAIEQMLGYRTQACLVCPSTLRRGLDALRQLRGSGDVVFERQEDAGECARIIASYAAKAEAEAIRFAHCGRHLWIRLERIEQETVNLVLRAPDGGPEIRSSDPPAPGPRPPPEIRSA